MVKTPSSSPVVGNKKDGKHPQNDHSLSTILIERALKIFNIIALFIEGEKKREKQLKAFNKKKRDLQLLEKQKKKAEDDKKKKSELKPNGSPADIQENEQMASPDNVPQQDNNEGANKSNDPVPPEDI